MTTLELASRVVAVLFVSARNPALHLLMPPLPSQPLWTLKQGLHRLTADLQMQRTNLWEVQVSHDGVFRYGERYSTRARAIEEADACRRELVQKGWTLAKPGEDVSSPIDPFELFEWLQVYYREIAARPDFAFLSGFERWLLLREHVRKSRAPNAQVRLDALDRLETPLKPQLLRWLEGRTEPAKKSSDPL